MKPKKAIKAARKGRAVHQVAALPYRQAPSGDLEFLLVTSRETRRFVLPKGWPMKRRSDAEAAALEAFQEAGVTGHAHPMPLGSYKYWKRVKNAFVLVKVVVYALEVEAELTTWKEHSQRRRKWLSLQDVIALVDEPELISLFRSLHPERGASVS